MYVLYVIIGFLILTGLSINLRVYWWAIRAWDFPRMQALVLQVVALILLLIFEPQELLRWTLGGTLAALALLDFYRIAPYFPLYPVESQNREHWRVEFSILSSNVFMQNRAYSQILQHVKTYDPDLILLIETDEEWAQGVSTLKSKYPYHYLVPQDNTYGMLLYSKYKLLNAETKFLVDEKVPSIFTKVSLEEGLEFELICVHPRPPRPQEGDSLQRDGELSIIAKHLSSQSDPAALVIGDLNDVAWSHSTRRFKRVSRTLDPRIGRGFYNTFPSHYPFIRVPLDHMFHTPRLAIDQMKVLSDIGSDHFPVFARFRMDRNEAWSGNPEEASQQDQRESKELREDSKDWEPPQEEVKE